MSSHKKKHSLKEDFISRMPANKQHLIALLFILVLPFMLFDDATLGGKQFMGHDTIQWRAGAESIIEYREAHDGEEPLWATNMFSGMPATTISVQSSVPHIDQLVRGLTKSIYPAAHFWILMAGCYLFFLLQGMRPLTSLLGAICISFTTYIPIILGAGHNSKFIAFVFIPWVLVGYWLVTRSDKKLLSFALFAIALTLEFRAGHPQVTYYFLYLLLFWWIYDTWQAYREGQIRSWVGTTGLLVLAGVLGFLGNAQQYWRLLEYSPYSIRGGSALAEGSGGLNMEYAFSWSQGFGELLTLIIPGLFGGSSAEAYWGPKSVTSGPHYLGAVAFVLALLGLLRSRNRLKYLFFGVGTLTLLFSLGYHFETFNQLLFEYVPYFDKFRTPEMWLIVTVFCYSVLGVYGLHSLIELAKSKSESLKPIIMPLGIALGIGLLFALGSNALLSFEKPGEYSQYAQQVAQQNNVSPENPQVRQAVTNFINTRLKPERKAIAKKDSIRYFIITLIVCGLIIAFYKRKLGLGFFLLGLCIVASYDYLTVGDRYTNEETMVDEQIDPEQVIQQRSRPIDQFLQNHVPSGEGWPYRVFPLGDNPFNNAVPSYFYPTIGGYSGAKLSYYQDLIDVLQRHLQKGQLHFPILNMLNVKYISIGQQLSFDNLKQVYSGDDGYVYENTTVLPKAFFVDSIRSVSSARAAIEAMQPAQAFNPAHTAIVEGTPEVDLQQDTSASVEVTHYDARSIELRSERDTEGYLVLSEIYYPEGWELAIDGEPVEFYKTNYVLRGFPVPAGEHTISMEFNPISYELGSKIAWASNLLQWGVFLFAAMLWYRRPQQAQENEQSVIR